jgi:hypothetical protein
MIYAKLKYETSGDPAPVVAVAVPEGNPPMPTTPAPVKRTAGNTVVADVVEYPVARPNRGWPDEVLADPELALGRRCPLDMRGSGWVPVVDQSPPLGLLETHGAAAPVADETGKNWTITRPVVAPSAAALAAEYDRLERRLHSAIDADAEQRRLDFITAGDGQAATYGVKLSEASAIVAGATPSAAAHPFVWKEAAALGKSAGDRAAEIVATSQAWLVIGSDIEAARQGAKMAVGAAKGDKAAMETAAAVDWTAIGGL